MPKAEVGGEIWRMEGGEKTRTEDGGRDERAHVTLPVSQSLSTIDKRSSGHKTGYKKQIVTDNQSQCRLCCYLL